MAQLAIRGHKNCGEQVVKILEMLGGVNKHNYIANHESLYFYISHITSVICCDWYVCSYISKFVIFTLEEFLEKYPYKVGDKVRFSDSNTPFTISRIWWDNNASELICTLEEQDIDVSSVDLQPYKEETMEKEISGAIVDRFICLEGYDFYDDKGNIIETKEITMKKKKPKYPKTYEECRTIINAPEEKICFGYKSRLLSNFQQLLVCRDAYWKIAGDWKPSKENLYEDLYCIGFNSAVITFKMQGGCKLLAFPTEEIRDAFYDNFKDLIEECKEII